MTSHKTLLALALLGLVLGGCTFQPPYAVGYSRALRDCIMYSHYTVPEGQITDDDVHLMDCAARNRDAKKWRFLEPSTQPASENTTTLKSSPYYWHGEYCLKNETFYNITDNEIIRCFDTHCFDKFAVTPPPTLVHPMNCPPKTELQKLWETGYYDGCVKIDNGVYCELKEVDANG
jgi:hypothetical protein